MIMYILIKYKKFVNVCFKYKSSNNKKKNGIYNLVIKIIEIIILILIYIISSVLNRISITLNALFCNII